MEGGDLEGYLAKVLFERCLPGITQIQKTPRQCLFASRVQIDSADIEFGKGFLLG